MFYIHTFFCYFGMIVKSEKMKNEINSEGKNRSLVETFCRYLTLGDVLRGFGKNLFC